MAIRVSVAALLSITILFVGVFAISESAQQNQPADNTSAESAGQTAEAVFEGILGGGAGEGIVWFGIAAIVLCSLGFLAYAGRSGGR